MGSPLGAFCAAVSQKRGVQGPGGVAKKAVTEQGHTMAV